jgi:hypothetical protein
MGCNLGGGVNFKQARGTWEAHILNQPQLVQTANRFKSLLSKWLNNEYHISQLRECPPFAAAYGPRYCSDIRFLQSTTMTCFSTGFRMPRPVTISWDRIHNTLGSAGAERREGVPRRRNHCRRNWLIVGAAKGSPWSHNRPKSCCCNRFPYKAWGCASHHQGQTSPVFLQLALAAGRSSPVCCPNLSAIPDRGSRPPSAASRSHYSADFTYLAHHTSLDH